MYSIEQLREVVIIPTETCFLSTNQVHVDLHVNYEKRKEVTLVFLNILFLTNLKTNKSLIINELHCGPSEDVEPQ